MRWRNSGAKGLMSACLGVVIAAVLPAAASGAWTDPGKEAALRGNALFEQRQYQDAALAYQLAKEKGYSTPEVAYNLGVANAELGELDAAAANFRKVIAHPDAGKLTNSARFNLGALEYRRAKTLGEKDAAAAMESLRNAANTFRDVLEADPSDDAAAKNVETIQREIKRLKDQIEKQKKDQDQQTDGSQSGGKNDQKQRSDQKDKSDQSKQQKSDQNQSDQKQDGSKSEQDSQEQDKQEQDQKDAHKQDNKDEKANQQDRPKQPDDAASDQSKSAQEQLSDLAKQQNDLAKQSEKLAQDQKKSREQQPGVPRQDELDRRSNDLQKKQEDVSNRTQEALEKMKEENAASKPDAEKEPPKPEGSKTDESQAKEDAAERAREAQQKAAQQLAKQDPAAAAQQQRAAARELVQAAGLQPPEPSEGTPQTEPVPAAVADLDAAKILDKERREANQKLMRLLRMRSGKPAAAGKDW